MIRIRQHGELLRTERFLKKIGDLKYRHILERYGPLGVEALANATPVRTGKTASSWTYEIRMSRGSYSLVWNNTNIVNGAPIAIMLQYGHGTKNGTFVQGIDYINPALRPIFDGIARDIWKEVTDA